MYNRINFVYITKLYNFIAYKSYNYYNILNFNYGVLMKFQVVQNHILIIICKQNTVRS